MTRYAALALVLFWMIPAQMSAQPTFSAAAVHPSRTALGRDGNINWNPVRFTATNATLKRLLFEAWQLPYSQIMGPDWLDSNEYDISATSDAPASPAQSRLMLQTLLTERFALKLHRETRERNRYELTSTSGTRERLAANASAKEKKWHYHGTLREFAGRLSLLLTIPLTDDPTRPSHASGPAIPVIDQTGLEGEYEINLDIRPDSGSDAFTIWQRALQEQVGLKLENRKGPVEMLVIDHAEKTPAGN